MTDDAERLAEEKVWQAREARLVSNRIAELYETPIKGNFDVEHLRAIHAHIFQDLPKHQPGVVRVDSDGWNKLRALEGRGPSHAVRYLTEGVEGRLNAVLQEFGGPDALKGVTVDDAAKRIAQIYGDLDHAHGFYEGNSRTLREFTRELTEAAGFTLDWVNTGVSTAERNALYIARDVAVLERVYPDLTEQRAMTTDDRAEYEAWFQLDKLRKLQGERSLEAIIRDGLSAERQREAVGQREARLSAEPPRLPESRSQRRRALIEDQLAQERASKAERGQDDERER